MLNKVSEKFHAWAKGWRVIILFIADALMMGYVMPVAGAIMALSANNSVMPLDLMFFYTPQKAFEMIEKYGAAGRAIYMKIELSADILYPIIYTLFYALLISWLFQRGFKPDSPMQTWNVMPMGAWLFDLLENVGTVSMVSMYIPAFDPGLDYHALWHSEMGVCIDQYWAGADRPGKSRPERI